jgi:hypothetical protein
MIITNRCTFLEPPLVTADNLRTVSDYSNDHSGVRVLPSGTLPLSKYFRKRNYILKDFTLKYKVLLNIFRLEEAKSSPASNELKPNKITLGFRDCDLLIFDMNTDEYRQSE